MRTLICGVVLLAACEEAKLQNRPTEPAPVSRPPPLCGNGVVDDGETCDRLISAGDPGACVVKCQKSGDACVTRELVGSVDDCTAACEETQITKTKANDGCCPAGNTFASDNDCAPDPALCGNGMKDPGETCDTAGASEDKCPTSCPAAGACATTVLQGTACTVKCVATLKPKMNGDGCCASPGDSDTDCAPIASPSCTAMTLNAEEAWRWSSASLVIKSTASTSVTPLVGKFTNDATPDVLTMIQLVNGGGPAATLVLFDGASSNVHWTKDLSSWKTSVYTHPAIADIDGDGKLEILVAEMGDMTNLELKGLTAFEHDGTFKWTSDPLPDPIPADAVGAISIADLEGDGHVEILLGNRVFDAQGHLKWAGAKPEVPAQLGRFAFAVELDPTRPGLEVLDGPNAYAADGTPLWSYTGIGWGHYAVGDCDNDGAVDIFIANEAQGVILDATGKPKAGPTALHNVSPVAAGDLDGDGDVEFIVNTQAKLVGYDCKLAAVFNSGTTVDISAGSGPVVADLDGDHKAEIAFADELKLRLFSPSGTQLFEADRVHVTALETPIIADIDGDGEAEIVAAQGRLVGGVQMPPGVIAYKAANGTKWAGARPIWNQHAFQPLSVFDDGKIAAYPGEFWKRANLFRGNMTTGSTCP